MSRQPDHHTPLSADELLRTYVSTEEHNPQMMQLRLQRDALLGDLDSVTSATEVTGLIVWLLRDNDIRSQGETLDETAERLGDLDTESDTDLYSDLIFQIKMAVERLDAIMLDTI